MIAYVSGKLAAKDLDEAIVEAGGLGYRVLIPASTYEALPPVGQPVTLHTYVNVNARDGTWHLFGFATEAERQTFEAVTGASGVGPKLALAVLSAMRPAELRDHVLQGDAAVLTTISGVGKKTAERLIVELKDRLADLDALEGGAPLTGGSDARAAARADALAALQSLGMSRADAERALRKVLRGNAGVQSADALVRLVLRER